MEFQHFEPSLFRFLKQLAKNNNRPWFQENKTRYERDVLEPGLAFIRAFRPRLKKISEFFTAIDRRSGGSIMRIYRDTRFRGADEPYKTNVGIQFRHEFVPWKMPGNNMRASLVTDLYNGKYPDIGIQTITDWLGHSPATALQHYSRVREADFQKVREHETKMSDKRNENGVAQKAAKSVAVRDGKERKNEKLRPK